MWPWSELHLNANHISWGLQNKFLLPRSLYTPSNLKIEFRNIPGIRLFMWKPILCYQVFHSSLLSIIMDWSDIISICVYQPTHFGFWGLKVEGNEEKVAPPLPDKAPLRWTALPSSHGYCSSPPPLQTVIARVFFLLQTRKTHTWPPWEETSLCCNYVHMYSLQRRKMELRFTFINYKLKTIRDMSRKMILSINEL